METKFSPGEWLKVDSEKNVNNPKVCGQLVGCFEIYSKSDTAWIAQVLDTQNKHGGANASLIITSPKLYAALEKAKKQIHVFALTPSAIFVADAYCAEIDMLLAEARGE